MTDEQTQTIPLRAVRYRIDPIPPEWIGKTSRDGWARVMSPMLRLKVTRESVEVLGLGPLKKLGGAFGAQLSLSPSETTMWTVQLSRFAGPGVASLLMRGAARGGPNDDYVALTSALTEESDYTLAVRPASGDLDGLKETLRAVGVTDA